MRIINFSEARNSLRNVIDQVVDDAAHLVRRDLLPDEILHLIAKPRRLLDARAGGVGVIGSE